MFQFVVVCAFLSSVHEKPCQTLSSLRLRLQQQEIFMPAGLRLSGKSLAGCVSLFAAMILFAGAPALGGGKTLHSFQGGNDGVQPTGSLIQDQTGNLYGTTSGGGGGGGCPKGNDGCGTVFELAPDGTESVLYAFAGGCDGDGPEGALLTDKVGNFYGTTSGGGDCADDGGYGTVFRLAPDGTETVLYTFKGGKDGYNPISTLIMDKKGNLYGTTIFGGKPNACGHNGCGTVFEVTPDGNKKTLHEFQKGDGVYPYAGLTMDQAGNLYGTTFEGGSSPNCDIGCGTVFKIAPDGTESILYSFQGGSDGSLPRSGLIADDAGNFYGTTEAGGSANYGTVFKVTPDGTETVLYSFLSNATGDGPLAGVILDKAGNLYGTTADGGGSGAGCRGFGCGVVFKLAPDGTETVLEVFKAAHGRTPYAGLLLGKNDILYGTTTAGGAGKHNDGVVFRVNAK
jgi:uncharacterized repeat protein (TIGR03803 family)